MNSMNEGDYVSQYRKALDKFVLADQKVVGTDGSLLFSERGKYYQIQTPVYPENPSNLPVINKELENARDTYLRQLMDLALSGAAPTSRLNEDRIQLDQLIE